MQQSIPFFLNEKEFNKKKASEVVSEIEAGSQSLSICEYGMRAFANVANIALKAQNTGLMTDYLDGEACDLLVTILSTFGEESQTIAAYGCAAIYFLSQCAVEFRELFGEVSACEVICFVLSMHVGVAEVSEFGCGAVAHLATHLGNSCRLVDSGVFDLLAQAGNFGFNIRHTKCASVAANVCLALGELATPTNTAKLVECGGSEIVVELLRLHLDIDNVAKASIKALCSIAESNPQLRESLGSLGCCELLLKAMRQYCKSAPIVQDACAVVMHLSLSPSNAQKLGQNGACELVVGALRDTLMDSKFGADICCSAMVNLVTVGSTTIENRDRLLAAGAATQVHRVQMNMKASTRAKEHAQQILNVLEIARVERASLNPRAKSSGGGGASPKASPQSPREPLSAQPSPSSRKSGAPPSLSGWDTSVSAGGASNSSPSHPPSPILGHLSRGGSEDVEVTR